MGPRSSTHTALRWAGSLSATVLACVCLGSLVAWTARWHWAGEIAASFAWHLGWTSVAAGLVLALARKRRLALFALFLGALHVGPELLLWLPDGRAGAPDEASGVGPSSLELASCNLLFDNVDHAGFARWLGENDPDVVLCSEVSVRWRGALLDLADRYPHQLLSPPDEAWWKGTWGTAVLSKVPFEQARLIPFENPEQRPILEVVLVLDGRRVTLRSVHPMRPGEAWRQALRDEVFAGLCELEWGPTSVLAGDLNVTSTSPAFGALLVCSDLRDSRLGFGRQPTWATPIVLPGLEIAIDHVLVGQDVLVLSRRTTELPGSDHRAVLTRVAVTDPPVPSLAH